MSEIQTEDQVVERPADVVTRIIAKIWVPLLIVLVAAAIALDQIDKEEDYLIEITTGGGSISVSFEPFKNTYRNIWLSGEAKLVYMGEFAC